MRSKYTSGLQVGYKWDTQYFPGRNNANPDALSQAAYPLYRRGYPPDGRKEGVANGYIF